MMRRALVLGSAVLILLAGLSSTAMADEVTDRMERSVGVVYSGEQSVICDQPDGRHSEVFEVGQNETGVIVTVDPRGTRRAAKALMLSTDLGDQYTIRMTEPDTVLGRPVDVVEIVDGNQTRVRLSFDVESSVLLMSEIFNGDGSTYCTTRFVAFTPGVAGPAEGAEVVAHGEASEAPPRNDPALPARLAGFDRLKLTLGSEPDVLSAFYGDGVFTFQLTNSARPISVPELDRQPRVTIDGHQYQRIFELGRVVYAWNTGLGGYVLVGELPVDVQERVLAELPDPKSRGFFERLWDDLFG